MRNFAKLILITTLLLSTGYLPVSKKTARSKSEERVSIIELVDVWVKAFSVLPAEAELSYFPLGSMEKWRMKIRLLQGTTKKKNQLQTKGASYLINVWDEAVSQLREEKVKSKAFPDELLADVVEDRFRFLPFQIIFIEHFGPFRNRKHLSQLKSRILVQVGRKKKDTFRSSVSETGAIGMAQFMPHTYRYVVDKYPDSNLNPSFQEGAREHVNAMKVQFCLLDLMVFLGDVNIRFRHQFKQFLVASYNGGVNRVKRLRSRHGKWWKDYLPYQTRHYLKKWRAISRR